MPALPEQDDGGVGGDIQFEVRHRGVSWTGHWRRHAVRAPHPPVVFPQPRSLLQSSVSQTSSSGQRRGIRGGDRVGALRGGVLVGTGGFFVNERGLRVNFRPNGRLII
jgi:hypothetical protein